MKSGKPREQKGVIEGNWNKQSEKEEYNNIRVSFERYI